MDASKMFQNMREYCKISINKEVKYFGHGFMQCSDDCWLMSSHQFDNSNHSNICTQFQFANV